MLFEEIIPTRGVSKKVLAQCDGLRANGVNVDLISLKIDNGAFYSYVNDRPIYSYGSGVLKYFKLQFCFGHIIAFIKNKHFDLIYIRYSRSSPFMILLFRAIRKLNVKIFLEIPTYPYDKERIYAKSFKSKAYRSVLFKLDKIVRRFYKYNVDRIVTVQNYDYIFDVPTIKISNGIDLNKVPLIAPRIHSEFNFIGVAELNVTHGYDRLIEGIGLYYEHGGKEDIHFYIIGDYSNVFNDYNEIIKKYNLEERIHLEGAKFGEDLDNYFSSADMAVGGLAGFRTGVYEAKPLKCVEYAARGVPFVYAELNSDFDNCRFVKLVSQDDSPIDVESIILFRRNLELTPMDIRSYVRDNITWSQVMNKIIIESY